MSFRLRTILGIALIESILLFILIVSSMDYLRSSNQEALYRRAQTTAELLAATAQEAVLSTDLASLQSFMEEVLVDPDILYARVYGVDGLLAQGGDAASYNHEVNAERSSADLDVGVFDVSADIKVADVVYGRVEIGLAVDGIQRVMVEARRHAFAIAGAELVLVALFSFLLGTYLTRELKALRTATVRVADGDLDYRINIHGRDELAQTAKAFNAMAQKLHVAFVERDTAQYEINKLNEELEIRVQQRTEQLTELNQQLEHQALHDGLTHIPNRTLFNDRLAQQLALGQRSRAPFALAILDLDHFKEINDVKGHQIGDLVLQEVAHRLISSLRRFDTVARMGGDEFAILLHEVGDEAHARSFAEHIAKVLAPPIQLDGEWLEIGSSLGLAVFPNHGDDAETLMRHADIAMYHAKCTHVSYCLYRSELEQVGKDVHTLRGELRSAIENGQMLLHFQPKVDFGSGVVNGVEALARWRHPQRGLLYPDNFIPLAEQSGLIQPLGIMVMQQALQQCVLWRKAGLELVMAVNISALDLMDEYFPQHVERLLEEAGAKPDWLELEITETAVMTNPVLAVQAVRTLNAMGVRLAIDDFGIGYSSMAYLKKLLAAKLKIDQSFVVDMVKNDDDAVIVRSAIELGHNLGLSVIAEGVEDHATWMLLKELGCDSAQGYYIAQPMLAAELEVWLEQSTWRPARRLVTAASSDVKGRL
ncbi:MAG: EAL domain-containing protein [Gammaproteobacteria bacterium]|nr:EAL domain-containing protein [Gammaproteobacteria bacterium]